MTFSYNGHAVLREVDLALESGELVALLGPNGSGKMTLLKTLCGILSPRAGRVTWDGSNLAELRRRDIALVPQELNVLFAFTDLRLDPPLRFAPLVRFFSLRSQPRVSPATFPAAPLC